MEGGNDAKKLIFFSFLFLFFFFFFLFFSFFFFFFLFLFLPLLSVFFFYLEFNHVFIAVTKEKMPGAEDFGYRVNVVSRVFFILYFYSLFFSLILLFLVCFTRISIY